MLQRQIVMSERPRGPLREHHFRSDAIPTPVPARGEVLLRNLVVSVSPRQRAVMNGPTYRPRLAPGDLIPSSVVAEVVDGRDAGPAAGSLVTAIAGWQEYSVVPAEQVRSVPGSRRLASHLGLFGIAGLTAYFGIREVADVRPGETVVVSGAGGGLGHLAAQLALVAGATVVGITSSDEKNEVLRSSLGLSATVNRRSPTFVDELQAVCPRGVDVYFDTAAGRMADDVLRLMRAMSRVVCAGGTAGYDADESIASGQRRLHLTAAGRRLRLHGIQWRRFASRWEEATEALEQLEHSGELRSLEDVRSGLHSAPGALIDVLAGRSLGQSVVRIGPLAPQ